MFKYFLDELGLQRVKNDFSFLGTCIALYLHQLF
jgi:hypothetical protein